ncbi:DUF742 domain-containing protein [Streptomyces aurantiacus]|uniref:DUF742 domain-containing protein n=1 Tax=Streptomyces aurantiacus TaxID=47760 RepID=A0A7G1PDH2_9ACTN|nr:DUF742 domain-containing protein [Streptomyces aurantiacus]BCL31836.1 hypothetical protein GCM10017557_66950 [Streptomyces aurantiacus]
MSPPQRRRRFPKAPPQEKPAPPPAAEGEGGQGRTRDLERLYVVTGQADGADRAELDLVTLIVACADAPPSAQPEQSALLRLCQAPMSVAEVSAYLNLPFSVVTVLLTELLTAELVQARVPIVRSELPDRSLLEAVMHGLQKL